MIVTEKLFSTGALFAHLVPIVALQMDGLDAIADRDAPGLTVIDDWSSFGQRATFSGTTLIDNVRVPKSHLVPGYKGYDRPTARRLSDHPGGRRHRHRQKCDRGHHRSGARQGARLDRQHPAERASDDPYTIQAVGDLVLRLHAAQALLDIAGRAVDLAVDNPTPGRSPRRKSPSPKRKC